MTERILVAGLGDVLSSDEGFGPFVVQTLKVRYRFPQPIDLARFGKPGDETALDLSEYRALILVDTIRVEGSPGTLRLLKKPWLLDPAARLSTRSLTVRDALSGLASGQGPQDALLIGCVPLETGTGVELTHPVRWAVDLAVAAVVDELDRLGVPALLVNAQVWPESGCEDPEPENRIETEGTQTGCIALSSLGAALQESKPPKPWLKRR